MSSSPRFNPRKVHGCAILPMPLQRAGNRDLVEHTVHHFLREDEHWGSAPPAGAVTPNDCLARMKNAGLGLQGVGSRDIPASWWSAPRLAHVLDAHDRGYYPRYVTLAERAGSPRDRTSKWVKDGDGYRAESGGYRLFGKLRQDSLLAISAYESALFQGSSPTGKGLGTFADLFRDANCQERLAGASGPVASRDGPASRKEPR